MKISRKWPQNHVEKIPVKRQSEKFVGGSKKLGRSGKQLEGGGKKGRCQKESEQGLEK